MRQLTCAALALTILLAACAAPLDQATPQPFDSAQDRPAPASTDIPPTQLEAVPRAPEIRFALIGAPADVNVWGMFDEQGAGYSNYALRNEYWPRLYTLTPPDSVFTPRAAKGFPSPIIEEGSYFTSTVELRSDLKWTDGLPFTAEDVAFTVNAALAFELGFDWKEYYSVDDLDHAEAIDPAAVKFYFKHSPNVSIWQYGALQGPILQSAYWSSRITDASALLPNDELRASIAEQRARIAELQPDVDAMNAEAIVLRQNGRQNTELAIQLKNSQSLLDEANVHLTNFLEEYAAEIKAAQGVLYALNDPEEPTLGAWMPAERQAQNWVNLVNPDFPFERPNFDRAVYLSFASESDAIKAFEDGKVDAVLFPNGRISSTHVLPTAKSNLNGSARFLSFNPSNAVLADPALRQAIACMIWSPTRDQSIPLSGFVLPGNEFWRDPGAATPCSELTDANLDFRLERAVQILKSAGYAWTVEPTKDIPGVGLVVPGGAAFPIISLLALSIDNDPLQAGEAAMIENRLKQLGIPLNVEYVGPQDIRYKVFSTKNYDMAILGWRLSLYPGYLCEWFGTQGQFVDNESSIKSECDALDVESDLEAARQHVFAIQSILVNDLPFVPLYAPFTYDIFENIDYPFENLLGGVNGAYGAPSFAVPSP